MHYRCERALLRRGLDKFARNEAGSLTVFSLFIILIMFIAGGMAVDFMRQEAARVRLSSTLDRAILAAADMDQRVDPKLLVKDFLAKEGLGGYAVNVSATVTPTARHVSAQASGVKAPLFMKMIGYQTLPVPASAGAEESMSDIEVSLVLDVSGSMSQNAKIDNLKVAAKDFVDTMFAQTAPGHTTISIVPYSTQVDVGADLLSEFNVTNEHTSSNCVDFADADYPVASISTTQLLQRTGHFDPTAGKNTRSPSTWVCRTTGGMGILPVSMNTSGLKAKIDSLVATGYTSIDVGMKWGSALLMPAARGAISGMIAKGKLPATSEGRPLDKTGDTLKVIVVMTDGINTSQWYLTPKYAKGASGVWRDPATGALSYQSGPSMYYLPAMTKGATAKWQTTPVGGSNAVQLSYPELWANVSVAWNAQVHADMSGISSDYSLWTSGLKDKVTGLLTPGVYSSVENAEKNARLDLICTAAKDAGITIYSIGFEVTDDSALVMQNCASTPSHFFRVEGVAIADAFKEIANDIGKLRLTQ